MPGATEQEVGGMAGRKSSLRAQGEGVSKDLGRDVVGQPHKNPHPWGKGTPSTASTAPLGVRRPLLTITDSLGAAAASSSLREGRGRNAGEEEGGISPVVGIASDMAAVIRRVGISHFRILELYAWEGEPTLMSVQ